MAPPPATASAHGPMLRRATLLAVAVACGLAVLKLVAWALSGSVAVAASFVDSLVDIAASGVNAVAVAVALRPPDAEHHFGHDKAEPLAGLAQGAFVLVSAAFLAIEATSRLLAPRPVAHSEVAIAVMAVGIIATAALVHHQRRVARFTRSTAIAADSLHYSADLLSHAAVIIGIALSAWLGWHAADPVLALLIAAWLVKGAITIARRSVDLLMDRALPDADRRAILAIATATPGVLGCQALRTRSAGLHRFVELRLEMARDLTLQEAHAIGDAVTAQITAAFPDAEVIVHHEPVEPPVPSAAERAGENPDPPS